MKEKLENFIESERCKELFNDFYGQDKKIHEKQKKRYLGLLDEFINIFNNKDYTFFSTPGRIEVIGNHTDHNLGKVVAAGITLDSIAIADKTHDNKITVYSKYNNRSVEIDLNNLEIIKEEDISQALIRGVVAGFKKNGYLIGGFNALIDSDVLPGSGLSSSAAFEVLIGTILNDFYNSGKVESIEIAKIGQFSENNYMQKPSGLMDQTACALAGIITIDFIKREKPIVKKLDFDFSSYDFSVLVVNTGGNHEDLTPFYASIPVEMKRVADFFSKEVLREVKFEDLTSNIKAIREKSGDRAILRSFHYLNENQRVDELVKVLEQKNFNLFLDLVNKSGNSSWKYLQNCYVPTTPDDQSVILGLTITEQFIKKIEQGACRIHGGGFAGTMLVFLPKKYVEEYIVMIEKVFGEQSVKTLNIRQNKSMKVF